MLAEYYGVSLDYIAGLTNNKRGTFAILILLSFLPEKKTRYLLPILIPSAMVVAHVFFYWHEKLVERKLLLGWDKLFFRKNDNKINMAKVQLTVKTYSLLKCILFFQ